MATFTEDDVRRLAHLARLELTADEVTAYTSQLGEILEFTRRIQSIETGAAPGPLASSPNALRTDVAAASLDRADVLAAAPDADAASGLFKVPRVLNG